jgi:RNA polymerase sigma factor (sigma-70 family)
MLKMANKPDLPVALQGDNELVAQMRPALVKYFKRKSGDLADAEDLAHEVLVRALDRRAWKSFEEAKGYIFRAAVNRWRDFGRRNLIRGNTQEFDETRIEIEDEVNSPERVLIGREEMVRVIQGLSELPERTREIFVLQRLEHMSYPQIAEGLGIALSTVEKHMIKALAYLTTKRRQPEDENHGK